MHLTITNFTFKHLNTIFTCLQYFRQLRTPSTLQVIVIEYSVTNLIYSSDLTVSPRQGAVSVSGEKTNKMAASSTANLALDDIKKADEIISMAVLGKCQSCVCLLREGNLRFLNPADQCRLKSAYFEAVIGPPDSKIQDCPCSKNVSNPFLVIRN